MAPLAIKENLCGADLLGEPILPSDGFSLKAAAPTAAYFWR